MAQAKVTWAFLFLGRAEKVQNAKGEDQVGILKKK
jgi:hypothetical protein